MNNKKYMTIAEVSSLLSLNPHVIRYWDSKFDGISTRLSKSKHRFFNEKNIKKINDLKNNLYDNGKRNYPLDLVNKIMLKKDKKLTFNKKINIFKEQSIDKNNLIYINELVNISNNLKNLLKK